MTDDHRQSASGSRHVSAAAAGCDTDTHADTGTYADTDTHTATDTERRP
jgi:hypothetical protein